MPEIIYLKESFADDYFHNLLRPFNVLPNFLFTTSDMMRDYYF